MSIKTNSYKFYAYARLDSDAVVTLRIFSSSTFLSVPVISLAGHQPLGRNTIGNCLKYC